MSAAQPDAAPTRQVGAWRLLIVLTAVNMASTYAAQIGGGLALATRVVLLSCLAVGLVGMALYAVRGLRRRREASGISSADRTTVR